MVTKVLSPLIQFVARQEAMLEEVALGRGQPAFEIGRSQIVRRVHALDAIAERVDVKVALAPGDHRHGADLRLPGSMKERLVLLAHDWTKAVHTAHIVHA